MPERIARKLFQTASEELDTANRPSAIQFFSLDEEAEWCQSWLATLKIPNLTGPIGAGTILWIANGRVLHTVISGSQLTVKDVVDRTHFFWPA